MSNNCMGIMMKRPVHKKTINVILKNSSSNTLSIGNIKDTEQEQWRHLRGGDAENNSKVKGLIFLVSLILRESRYLVSLESFHFCLSYFLSAFF